MRYCRNCTKLDKADNNLVFVNDLRPNAMTQDVGSDVTKDPTLPRAATECTNCGHDESVFFQAQTRGDDGMKLVFMCTRSVPPDVPPPAPTTWSHASTSLASPLAPVHDDIPYCRTDPPFLAHSSHLRTAPTVPPSLPPPTVVPTDGSSDPLTFSHLLVQTGAGSRWANCRPPKPANSPTHPHTPTRPPAGTGAACGRARAPGPAFSDCCVLELRLQLKPRPAARRALGEDTTKRCECSRRMCENHVP